eukprot:gene14477-biopygen2082
MRGAGHTSWSNAPRTCHNCARNTRESQNGAWACETPAPEAPGKFESSTPGIRKKNGVPCCAAKENKGFFQIQPVAFFHNT